MVTRRTSWVLFTFVVVSAVAITCITLYSLVAGFSRAETLFLLIGCLIVIWAILFSFFEVYRIAARSKRITGSDELIDPDAPRKIIVEPPTGEATPHHESHAGSEGFDQGQLTSRLPDSLFIRDLLPWVRHRRKAH